jgi:ABC-2 type transport system permease protein
MSATTSLDTRPTSSTHQSARRPGVGAVYAVEIGKLSRQTKVRVTSIVMLAAPWLFILLVLHQDRLPLETLYGRYLKITGFATPMVVLVTAAQWLLPLIASFISGDMFSGDDNHGTFKTILTRSVTRGAVYWGKVLAALSATVLLVLAIGASSLAAGLACVGAQDFISVGGTSVPAGAAFADVALSWVSVLPGVVGFAAIALCVSILTRNSVLGVVVPVVVGLVCQMYMFLNGWDTVRHLMLNWTMIAWRGLLDDPSYAAPFGRGVLVSLVYTVVFLALGYLVFRRRDIKEG